MLVIVVYDVKFVRPLEFELVAPMPEQLKTTTMHFYKAPRKNWGTKGVTLKGLLIISTVPVCSGMGATKLKYWVLRS